MQFVLTGVLSGRIGCVGRLSNLWEHWVRRVMEWLASANSNAWNVDRFPVADVSLPVMVEARMLTKAAMTHSRFSSVFQRRATKPGWHYR